MFKFVRRLWEKLLSCCQDDDVVVLPTRVPEQRRASATDLKEHFEQTMLLWGHRCEVAKRTAVNVTQKLAGDDVANAVSGCFGGLESVCGFTEEEPVRHSMCP